jgi:hypothetical protein
MGGNKLIMKNWRVEWFIMGKRFSKDFEKWEDANDFKSKKWIEYNIEGIQIHPIRFILK